MYRKMNNMEEKKKSKAPIILLIFILMAGCIAGGWFLGKKQNEKDTTKDEQKTELKEETKKEDEKEDQKDSPKEDQKDNKKEPELIALDIDSNINDGVTGIYSDLSAKSISEDAVIGRFAIDGNTFYYLDIKGNIYSLDITKKEKPKQLAKISNTDALFGAKNNKIYYMESQNNDSKTYAITLDLESGKETKKEVKKEHIHVNSYRGSKAIVDDNYHVSIPPKYYIYDFETNGIKELGQYDNMYESRPDALLFQRNQSNGKEYCLYSIKENKEKQCVKASSLKEPDTIYEVMPTTDGKTIYVISDNKVLGCDNGSCKNVVYTLTKEEQNAPYLGILSIGNNLLLIVGLNEKCEEGCSYDYATYNISKDHEKLNYSFETAGFNTTMFIK